MKDDVGFEPVIIGFVCNSVFFFGLFTPLADPPKEKIGLKRNSVDLLEKRRCFE
jgi:hypothetical protein